MREDKPTVIGLTGGIGTGKSTVSNYLIQKGFVVFDADQISREVVMPGSPVLLALVTLFGNHILQEDGFLNRKVLAAIIFSDTEQRKKTEAIMHKEILRVINTRVETLARSGYKGLVFIDAPLIFETELAQELSEIWLVDAEDDIRIARIMKRDGSSLEEILGRIKSQMSREEKIKRANIIIENSGSEEELYQQIDKLILKYEKAK